MNKFAENINFIIDCATSEKAALKSLLFNCEHEQFEAIVETVINADKLTCSKTVKKLAKEVEKLLLTVSTGLWRVILQDECEKLRKILASICLDCVEQELLEICCCDEDS